MIEILQIIWKRRIFVLSSIILACLMGFVFSLIISPVYKATTEIAIQPTDVIYGFSQDPKANLEYLKHQAEIIQSDEVIDNAIDKLHLKITDVLSQNKPRESFLKHIKIEPIGNSLIKITATAKTPQLAAGIASQLANSFLELHRERSFAVSRDAMGWLTETSKLSKDLKETEDKLLNFIKDNEMQSPEQQIEAYQQKADRLIEEKSKLLAELEENKQVLDRLKLVNKKEASEILTQRMAPSIEELLEAPKREYKNIILDIEQMLRTYKQDHPRIVELNQRKDAIAGEVKSRIEDLSKELSDRIDYSNDRISEIETETEKIKEEYSKLLDTKREYDLLKIKLDNLSRLYEETENQLKTSGIALVSVSIVGFAREGNAPVSKSRPTALFLILFTLTGLIAGLLTAVFLERSTITRKAPAEPDETPSSEQPHT